MEHPFNTAVVFSGGGTRYAIYGGMFAALENHGMKPDLIISVCGGSIAAAIINSFATNEERKEYFQSRELYYFIRNINLSRERKLYRIGVYCLRLLGSKKKAPYIRDIFNRYLVDMPQDLTVALPSLEKSFGQHVPCIMIGSEVLFDKTDVERPRGDYALYRKVLFTDETTAGKIDPQQIQITADSYKDSAIDASLRIETHVPVPLAVRISLSDMFYVQPVKHRDRYYAGGIIDLLPVELAETLAKNTIFEKKEPFTWMEEGLVRAVFGYNGNERMAEVNKRDISYRIDTTDVTTVLKGHYIRKEIDLLRMQVGITLPHTYEQFREDMRLQWEYGYERAEKVIKNKVQ